MRTYEEIAADLPQAHALNDAPVLRRLAEELRELGTPLAEAQALNALGSAQKATGDHRSALENYHRALELFQQLGDRRGFAHAHGNLGVVYVALGDHAKAIEHAERLLDLAEELGDRTGVARAISSIGIVYTDSGDYPRALEMHQRALGMYEELGDRVTTARVISNIGTTLCNSGEYTRGLEFHERALALHKELGNASGVAHVTANIGIVYHLSGNYQRALEYYERAIALHQELGNDMRVTSVKIDLCELLIDHGHHDRAAMLLDQRAQTEFFEPQQHALVLFNRASLATHHGDLDGAKDLLEQALTIVLDMGARDLSTLFHQRLRDLAQKRGDFEGYIHHNTEHLRIAEEIRGRQATQRLAMLEAEQKMQVERREREKEKALLYGALPESVATRMLRGEDVSGDHVESASVLFMDIAGFTTISDRIPAGHVVHLLKAIFRVCDDVCTKHGLTKIKTIGDSYLAVAGVPEPLSDHATRAALAAIDMLNGLNNLELTMDPKLGDTSWTKDVGDINIRIGLHCGPLVAGIVGEQRLQYDVWGDTVNVASRMESTGEPGRIHVSEAFKDSLTPCLPDSLTLFKRGEVVVKGKGPMTTYWLEGA